MDTITFTGKDSEIEKLISLANNRQLKLVSSKGIVIENYDKSPNDALKFMYFDEDFDALSKKEIKRQHLKGYRLKNIKVEKTRAVLWFIKKENKV